MWFLTMDLKNIMLFQAMSVIGDRRSREQKAKQERWEPVVKPEPTVWARWLISPFPFQRKRVGQGHHQERGRGTHCKCFPCFIQNSLHSNRPRITSIRDVCGHQPWHELLADFVADVGDGDLQGCGRAQSERTHGERGGSSGGSDQLNEPRVGLQNGWPSILLIDPVSFSLFFLK